MLNFSAEQPGSAGARAPAWGPGSRGEAGAWQLCTCTWMDFCRPRDPRLEPWKHEGVTQAGLASCHRKVSRCCRRGSRGEVFIEGGIAIRQGSYHTDLSVFLTLFLDVFPKGEGTIG